MNATRKRRIKPGDRIEIGAAVWRGTPNAEGRETGVRIRINTTDEALLELELSIEEFGKLVAGLGGEGTIQRIK